jgi:hypothetical protein
MHTPIVLQYQRNWPPVNSELPPRDQSAAFRYTEPGATEREDGSPHLQRGSRGCWANCKQPTPSSLFVPLDRQP